MPTVTKQTGTQKGPIALGIQRNYHEVIEFLDQHWDFKRTDKDLATIKKLDQALGNPSKNTTAIFVSGTNGKGLTIHFTTKLLQEEGIKVGSFSSPHILTYNERITINNEAIANKAFTELANEVINTADSLGIKADSRELLTMISLLYFKQNNIDIALLETHYNNAFDPINVCYPAILAITRITRDDLLPKSQATADYLETLIESVKPGTHVVSADQSKLNLQVMLELTEKRKGEWSMPIRKLAQLPYPFEQLHGRCAALAERICQIYIANISQKKSAMIMDSLLIKQKGQRGRPTLAAKKARIDNPQRTLEQFWKETINDLPAHFQILDKEKPTILLDNASNIDALKNLLLGIRLLHYQRPLKGIAFIFGCDKKAMNIEEFLRLLRYFSKKNSGQIILCPIDTSVPGVQEESWNVNDIINDSKNIKIKAKATANFAEAFDLAKKMVDERNGLVIITGSQSIITQYWHHKGIKKI